VARPQVRRPGRQHHFGMSTGQARRASVLTSACLRASGASPRHSASIADGHRPACSSKRTVRLINGIALDQCRVRERYPARRPFLHLRARRSSSDPHAGHESVKETDRRCDALSP